MDTSRPVPYIVLPPVSCRYCNIRFLIEEPLKYYRFPNKRELLYFHPNCYYIFRDEILGAY